MSVPNNNNNCYKCELFFADFDIPVKCDGCYALVHNKCSGLKATELKCLSLKNRNLKFFCDLCKNSLWKIPESMLLINHLLTEVSELEKTSGNNLSSRSEEFIINEVQLLPYKLRQQRSFSVSVAQTSCEQYGAEVTQLTTTHSRQFKPGSVYKNFLQNCLKSFSPAVVLVTPH